MPAAYIISLNKWIRTLSPINEPRNELQSQIIKIVKATVDFSRDYVPIE